MYNDAQNGTLNDSYTTAGPATNNNTTAGPATSNNTTAGPAVNNNTAAGSATSNNTTAGPAASNNTPTQTSGSSGCTSGKICNPLNVNSIQSLISTALMFVVNILAIAGVMYIIWTGFLFVKAQGKPEELKTANLAFVHAIIGMAIILGAWGIAKIIANTVNKVTSNNNVTLSLPNN